MINRSLKDEQPILQILDSKRMHRANNLGKERYRIWISDGICSYTQAILSAHNIPPEGPTNFTVIKVTEFDSNILFEGRSDVV